MKAIHRAIAETLEQARACDEQATALRRRAGFLLAEARAAAPTGAGWYREAGLDERTASLLLEMAAGGKERGACTP